MRAARLLALGLLLQPVLGAASFVRVPAGLTGSVSASPLASLAAPAAFAASPLASISAVSGPGATALGIRPAVSFAVQPGAGAGRSALGSIRALDGKLAARDSVPESLLEDAFAGRRSVAALGSVPVVVPEGEAPRRAAVSLMREGLEPAAAAVIVGRVERRLDKLAAHQESAPDPLPPGMLRNAFLLTVLLGTRPGTILYFPDRQLKQLRAAARAVHPGLRFSVRRLGNNFNQVFLYDPEVALAHMRRATKAGIPAVSFAAELDSFGADKHARRRLLRWLDERTAAFLRDYSEHRLGVLLGYPHNDVADMMRQLEFGASSNGPGSVSVPYGGNQNNAIFWLADDPAHPETRRGVAVYRAALDLAHHRLK